MRIGVLGINHKQAPLFLREQIAKCCDKWFGKTKIIHPRLSYVLLSTCNRSEIYFHASDLTEAHVYLLSIIRKATEEELEQKIYSYFGVDCFRQLVRVSAGLDSAILGESEIQRQVKAAYQLACQQRPLPAELHFLFQKAFKISKEIRTHYPIYHPSLEETLYQVMTQTFPSIQQIKILLMGVSRINTTILSWLSKKKIGSITCCNRTLEKAKLLNFPYLTWDDKHKWPEFDVIILGTKSPDFVIRSVPDTLVQSKLLIDLSVPRNVAPWVGEHPFIRLFNIDQLANLNQQEQTRLTAYAKQIDRDVIGDLVTRQMAIARLKAIKLELKTLHAPESEERRSHLLYFPSP